MTTSKISSGQIATRDPSAAWLTPELVLALAPESHKDWTIPAGVNTQVLTPNPRRIGLVFIVSVTTTDGTYVSPYGDASVFGVPIPASTRVVSFAVDDLYSLVGRGWSVYHASGCTIRVVEFVRPA